MDGHLPVNDNDFLSLLHQIVSQFTEHETVPDSFFIDHAYVFGSRERVGARNLLGNRMVRLGRWLGLRPMALDARRTERPL